jgi:hypothetical protein
LRHWYRDGATTPIASPNSGTSLTVEQCIEVAMTEEQIATSPAATIYPEAARAATEGLHSFWVWVVRSGDD